eukprot:TRINITY_DN3951_c0_g1_i7.p6 TRINITY_DN3951_c0_g1~~TRINITY_DN3951_c0_g1_i7.p6  ORF type:complete len:104 (-),score=35.68 TRINITY_DN3951_c0_g1_i7:70-381(-)
MMAPKKVITFAFSLYRALMAFWIKVFTVMAGIMHDITIERDNGYYWMAMMLFFAEIFAFILLVIIMFVDLAGEQKLFESAKSCLLYTSPSPRDQRGSRMPSSA